MTQKLRLPVPPTSLPEEFHIFFDKFPGDVVAGGPLFNRLGDGARTA